MPKNSTPNRNSTPEQTTKTAAKRSRNANPTAVAIADLLNNPATPPETIHAIVSFASGAAPAEPAARFSGFTFSPEIEARRAGFQRIAESIAFLMDYDWENAGGLDLFDPHSGLVDEEQEPYKGDSFTDGIAGHIANLWDMVFMRSRPEVVLHLYAEMRMIAEEFKLENRKLHKKSEATKEKERLTRTLVSLEETADFARDEIKRLGARSKV